MQITLMAAFIFLVTQEDHMIAIFFSEGASHKITARGWSQPQNGKQFITESV